MGRYGEGRYKGYEGGGKGRERVRVRARGDGIGMRGLEKGRRTPRPGWMSGRGGRGRPVDREKPTP